MFNILPSRIIRIAGFRFTFWSIGLIGLSVIMQVSSASGNQGTILGRVVDAVTGNGISGARIRTNLNGTAISDDDGKYVIAGHQPTGFAILAKKPDEYYDSDYYEGELSGLGILTMPPILMIPLSYDNEEPTLNPISDQTIQQSSGYQTVQLSGITSGSPNEKQSLAVTAVSGNPDVAGVTVNYSSPNSTGSLIIIPVHLGTSVITVTVDDGGLMNNILCVSFNVTVTNLPNSPPSIDPIPDVWIQEGSGYHSVQLTGISSGSPNENQTLTISAVSDDPVVIPNLGIEYTSPNYSAYVIFAAVGDANGSVRITVTVNDGASENNVITRSFSVHVTPVIDLGDAITGLKALSGIQTGRLFFDGEINENDKPEIHEVIYVLQILAGTR